MSLETNVNKASAGILAASTAAACLAYNADHGGLAAPAFLWLHDNGIVPAQDAMLSVAGKITDISLTDITLGATGLAAAGYIAEQKIRGRSIVPKGLKRFWSLPRGRKVSRIATATLGTLASMYTAFVALHTINNRREIMLETRQTLPASSWERGLTRATAQRMQEVADDIAVVISHCAPFVSPEAQSNAYALSAAETEVSHLIGKPIRLPTPRASILTLPADFYNILLGEPLFAQGGVDPGVGPARTAHESSHRFLADESITTIVTLRALERAYRETSDIRILQALYLKLSDGVIYIQTKSTGETDLHETTRATWVSNLWSKEGRGYGSALAQELYERAMHYEKVYPVTFRINDVPVSTPAAVRVRRGKLTIDLPVLPKDVLYVTVMPHNTVRGEKEPILLYAHVGSHTFKADPSLELALGDFYEIRVGFRSDQGVCVRGINILGNLAWQRGLDFSSYGDSEAVMQSIAQLLLEQRHESALSREIKTYLSYLHSRSATFTGLSRGIDEHGRLRAYANFEISTNGMSTTVTAPLSLEAELEAMLLVTESNRR